jgi:uncharacterized membrane protein
MSSTTSVQPSSLGSRSGRNTAWLITLIFCLIALVTSGYLSWTTLTGTQIVCIEGGVMDCAKVESSIYSRFMGVPVAYLGFITYASILALLLLEKRVRLVREYGMLAILGLALFGFLFHSYLTFVSITRLGAICPWCVLTNFSMGVILVATLMRVVKKFVLVSDEVEP